LFDVDSRVEKSKFVLDTKLHKTRRFSGAES